MPSGRPTCLRKCVQVYFVRVFVVKILTPQYNQNERGQWMIDTADRIVWLCSVPKNLDSFVDVLTFRFGLFLSRRLSKHNEIDRAT